MKIQTRILLLVGIMAIWGYIWSESEVALIEDHTGKILETHCGGGGAGGTTLMYAPVTGKAGQVLEYTGAGTYNWRNPPKGTVNCETTTIIDGTAGGGAARLGR